MTDSARVEELERELILLKAQLVSVNQGAQAVITGCVKDHDSLAAKLHAAEEREARLRKALEKACSYHELGQVVSPEDDAYFKAALSASPQGRLAKLEAAAAAKECLSFHSPDATHTKNSWHRLNNALSNLAGEG